MKTILIIGAGKAQVPLIKAAKKENYHTIVCDYDPGAPGVPLADEYYKVSTRDRDGLLDVAKRKNINGVIANSDYAMCEVAYIAENLSLVGNPEESIAILSSKSRFREMQEKNGLFTPRCVAAASSDQQVKNHLSFPVIVKPDNNSGSRGIAIIKQAEDCGLENSLREAIKISRNGKAIIEEYVPMPSHETIEGEVFVHNGEILWDGLFQTIRSESAPMLPMTYIFPLPETEERVRKAKDALEKAFHAAGVVHGEYNVELYFAVSGEPFIIEINPRQGGYELPRLVYEHCGIDYYRLLVTTAMRDEGYWESLREIERENRLIVHHMLFPRNRGRFKGISIAGALDEMVYRKHSYVEAGTVVENTVDAASCIGCVDIDFSDREEQLMVSRNIEQLIKVEVE